MPEWQGRPCPLFSRDLFASPQFQIGRADLSRRPMIMLGFSSMRTLSRLLLLSLVVAACTQKPSPPRPPCSTDSELGSLCGFENPEDVTYVPGYGILVVSNLRLNNHGGFLSALPVAGGAPTRLWPPDNPDKGGSGFARMASAGEPGCGAPDADLFAPHGVYLDVRDPLAPLLYVVNHGGRESVEIFSFGRRENETLLFWTACIELPEGTSGNDVAVAADGEVIVANYMPPTHKMWSNLKTAVGLSTGDVIVWNLDKRWRHLPGTTASGPNGVEVSADDKSIYYSSTGSGTITRVARDGSQARQVNIGGKPDNLTWSAAGTLLAASHESGLEFMKCLRQQPCRSPWFIAEIEPESLQFKTLLRHDGDVVGAVAAALEVNHSLYLSSVFDDRIGVWRRPLTPDATRESH